MQWVFVRLSLGSYDDILEAGLFVKGMICRFFRYTRCLAKAWQTVELYGYYLDSKRLSLLLGKHAAFEN